MIRSVLVLNKSESLKILCKDLKENLCSTNQNLMGLSVDVYLTRDGIPVVIHDSFISELYNNKNKVYDLSINEITGWKYNKDLSNDLLEKKIFKLEEILILLEEIKFIGLLNIELKAEKSFILELHNAVNSIINHFNNEYIIKISSTNLAHIEYCNNYLKNSMTFISDGNRNEIEKALKLDNIDSLHIPVKTFLRLDYNSRKYMNKKIFVTGDYSLDVFKEAVKKMPFGIFVSDIKLIKELNEIINSGKLFNLIEYNNEIRTEICDGENHYVKFLDKQFPSWKTYNFQTIKDNIFYYRNTTLVFSIRFNVSNGTYKHIDIYNRKAAKPHHRVFLSKDEVVQMRYYECGTWRRNYDVIVGKNFRPIYTIEYFDNRERFIDWNFSDGRLFYKKNEFLDFIEEGHSKVIPKKIKIQVNDQIISLLENKNIFLQRDLKFNNVPPTLEFESDLRIEAYTQQVELGGRLLSMGSSSYIKNSALPINTKIGRYCSIARNVRAITGGRHPQNRFTTSPISLSNPTEKGIIPPRINSKLAKKFKEVPWREKRPPIIIGNDVWIGQDVLLKPGIVIGDGSIIAQRSIVTKDVPPYSIVAGAPAIVRKKRFSEEVIKKLKKLQWWNYPYWEFEDICADDEINIFIEKLDKMIKNQEIHEYHPDFLTADELLKIGNEK